MVERSIEVKNPHGLHARPAALFVQKAASFPSSVTVSRDGRETDAKSILGIMSLGIEQGETIVIRADGDGSDDVLDALAAILQDGSL